METLVSSLAGHDLLQLGHLWLCCPSLAFLVCFDLPSVNRGNLRIGRKKIEKWREIYEFLFREKGRRKERTFWTSLTSMSRRSASAQAGGVQSSLHDFWPAADNNKPKLPPDLWAKIAAYVVAHFFEEPIAVGESSDLYYPISLYYTRVKERENKENIQCISTTCKTFHDEVKKLLNMDHLVFLKSFWQQVILQAIELGNIYEPEGEVEVAPKFTNFHRLWYGTPKGVCVMVHRGPDLLTMQCGQKEHEGPKICFHITDAYMQGASASDVKITAEIVRVTHALLNDRVQQWLMKQCALHMDRNLFACPSVDLDKFTLPKAAKWDWEDGFEHPTAITLWQLVQWTREKTRMGAWVSQLIINCYPEEQWDPGGQALFFSKIMGGMSMMDAILVNIVGNEARVMVGAEIVRMVVAFFNDDIEVTYGLPAQAWTERRCKYSKLERYVQKRCKAYKIDISAFDNLSHTHEENYVNLIRKN